MTAPTFEWDSDEARANEKKHGISFEEAITVFQDPLAVVHADPNHSASEEREILIGHSGGVTFFSWLSPSARVESALSALE